MRSHFCVSLRCPRQLARSRSAAGLAASGLQRNKGRRLTKPYETLIRRCELLLKVIGSIQALLVDENNKQWENFSSLKFLFSATAVPGMDIHKKYLVISP